MTIERAFRPGDLSARVLAFALALAPPLAVFSPLGLAPLFAVAALAALALPVGPEPRRWAAWPVLVGLGLVHLWQLVSLAWCLDPAQALRSTLGTIALSVGGLVLLRAIAAAPTAVTRRLIDATVLGLLIGTPLFLIEFHFGLPLRRAVWPLLTGHAYTAIELLPQRLDRAAVLFLLMALPAGLALARRRAWPLLAVCGLLTAVAVLTSLNATAKIALLLGPVVMLAFWRCGRLGTTTIRVALVALLLLPPFLFARMPETQQVWYDHPSIPNSIHHRLTIWRFTAQKTMEKPVFGWGMDASRAIPGGEDEVIIYPPPNTRWSMLREQFLPLHPHDATLQIWLELGGIGALLALAALFAITAALRRAAPPRRALGLGQIAQVATVASLSFGLWQAWWLASIWLAAALALAATGKDEA